LAAASFLMGAEVQKVESRAASTKVQMRAHAWQSGKKLADLEREKSELSTRAKAIGDFMGSRMIWASCLREATLPLPESMVLKLFDGDCAFAGAGSKMKSGQNRYMSMEFEAPIPESGSIPAEIDSYVRSIRSSSLIRDRLPVVKLSGLRWTFSESDKRPLASFKVMCMPEPKKAKPASPAPH
jgi:hypothetical protein